MEWMEEEKEEREGERGQSNGGERNRKVPMKGGEMGRKRRRVTNPNSLVPYPHQTVTWKSPKDNLPITYPSCS